MSPTPDDTKKDAPGGSAHAAVVSTRLFTYGRHPCDVQDLLRHGRIGMTLNVYTASILERLRDAADSLGDLLGDPDEAAEA
jgi:hypothetical protein